MSPEIQIPGAQPAECLTPPPTFLSINLPKHKSFTLLPALTHPGSELHREMGKEDMATFPPGWARQTQPGMS